MMEVHHFKIPSDKKLRDKVVNAEKSIPCLRLVLKLWFIFSGKENLFLIVKVIKAKMLLSDISKLM
jgi:hypothetical protein